MTHCKASGIKAGHRMLQSVTFFNDVNISLFHKN